MATNHQPISWLPVSWTVGLMTVCLAITTFVNSHVPENYMDEPFHVPMTQRYCKADFCNWDPKVTTFPGLYVIGAAYAWLSSQLLSLAGVPLEVTCSGPYLRSLNALLAVATVQVAYAISRELQGTCSLGSTCSNSSSSTTSTTNTTDRAQQQRGQAAVIAALVVGLLPTQFFFAFLFYTDVPSLLFVLVTELLLLRRHRCAAAAAAAAIGMRQTNAVWVTFLSGAAMLRDILATAASSTSSHDSSRSSRHGRSGPQTQRQNKEDSSTGIKAADSTSKKQQVQPQTQQQHTQHYDASSDVTQIFSTAWRMKGQLLKDYCLLLSLPVVFVAFVIGNGGITLGDREAHAPSMHLMQPLYFAVFTLVSAAPFLSQKAVLQRVQQMFRAAPLLFIFGLLAALGAAAYCVAKYSLVHPYLLADNRHYTFYIWKRIFSRYWLARYLLAPGYVVGWVLLIAALMVNEHWLWVVAYAASCWVTLVPAWLIEFRYFTIPFALAVLHMPSPDVKWSSLVVAAYCCVNALTLWVFALKSYTWGDGSVARFMW